MCIFFYSYLPRIPKEPVYLNTLLKGKREMKAPRVRNVKVLCWLYPSPKWGQTAGRAGNNLRGANHTALSQHFAHWLRLFCSQSTVATTVHLALFQRTWLEDSSRSLCTSAA